MRNKTNGIAERALLSFILITIVGIISCAPKDNGLRYTPPHPPFTQNGRTYADILREGDKDFIKALYDPSLTAVTKEFGFTVIDKNKSLPFHSELATADITPWSSWWFPKRDSSFFDDSNAENETDYNKLSILSKYDLMRSSRSGEHSSAVNYERRNFNRDALPWEGLCDAWAIASISVPEPKRNVTVKLNDSNRTKITFNVKDLKGLLLKTFEAIDDHNFKYYGQKFTGQESSWIYPDIFPEQFHRLLEIQLFEKHKPFIIDTDQGTEMWSAPVFKANYIMTEIPNEPNSLYVRTWVYIADSIKTDDKAFVGTKEVVREYNYVLKGYRNDKNELVINLGYWVTGPTGNNSRHDHPDFIIIPPDRTQLVRKSWNPEIDISLIDEILSKSY